LGGFKRDTQTEKATVRGVEKVSNCVGVGRGTFVRKGGTKGKGVEIRGNPNKGRKAVKTKTSTYK